MISFDRITSDPAIQNGEPCIRGTRLTVQRVLEVLSFYSDREQVLAEYPELEEEDISQALAYAATTPNDQTVDLHPAIKLARLGAIVLMLLGAITLQWVYVPDIARSKYDGHVNIELIPSLVTMFLLIGRIAFSSRLRPAEKVLLSAGIAFSLAGAIPSCTESCTIR